jgi:hypothetical protein
VAARAAQARTPITDGAYGKPWVHRPKDLVGWWTNAHVERLDGVEVGATAWVPASKQVRFTELGVPAVDKGANQPNLFPDPRSSENGRPEGSDGARDEALQRRALEVLLDGFDPASPGGAAQNPLVGGVRMVEHQASHLWCWDARPWPAFPALAEVWGDGPNWRTGHWLNGRLGAAPVGELAAALSARFGGPPIAHDAVADVVAGYVVERPMTGRAALEPLAAAFGLDLVSRGATLELKPRGRRPVAALEPGELARVDGEDQARLVRAQESELPREVAFTVSDAEREFRRVVVSARRATGAAERESRSDFALVMPAETAEAHAALALRRAWAARETAGFALARSRLALEPGDLVTLGGRPLRLARVVDRLARAVEAEGEDPGLARPATGPLRPPVVRPPPFAGRPHALVLDVPALPGDDAPHRPKLAVTAEPWPGGQILWRARAGGYEPVLTIERRATIGLTLDALPAGPVWRFDRAASFRVRLASGALAAVSEEAVLDGANGFALRHPSGAWEVLQAAGAELVAERTFRLVTLLRGQAGTEALASEAVPAGAPIVLIDGAFASLPVEPDDVGRALGWRLSPPGLPHDAPEALAFSATPAGVGLLPLAPVHPRARRTAAGVEIGFIRRTRTGGDGWELAEVPLGEERERYLVDVLAAGAPVRSFDVAEPRALYAAAEELADFGAAQASLSVRVRQWSALAGPGRPLEAVVDVTS